MRLTLSLAQASTDFCTRNNRLLEITEHSLTCSMQRNAFYILPTLKDWEGVESLTWPISVLVPLYFSKSTQTLELHTQSSHTIKRSRQLNAKHYLLVNVIGTDSTAMGHHNGFYNSQT